MTLIQQLYPGDAIASFVIRVLIEITLITVTAILFARLFGKQNPAFRHGVCVCALLCVVLAPVSTLTLQSAGWRTFEISLDHASQVQRSQSTYSERSAPRELQTPSPFWTLERARSAASLTILAWVLGSAVLLLRLWSGSRKVHRLLESSRQIQHPTLDVAMERLQRSQTFPNVPVRFAGRLHSPVVVGTLHPIVILPEKLLGQLDVDQMRCVLAHELTHVRQRDPLVGLIQRIVEATYWPHPLVHLLNRDLIRAREEVCDNVALHGTTAPYYANTLLKVALGISSKPTVPGMIGLMTPPWKLEERVKGLLDPRRRLTTTMNTRHLALMAITLATGTALVAGTRVVAAPVPIIPQETVKIVGHIDAASHSVKYKAKTYKPAQIKSKSTIQVLTLRDDDVAEVKELSGTLKGKKFKVQLDKSKSGGEHGEKSFDAFTIGTDDQKISKSISKTIKIDALDVADGKTVVKTSSGNDSDPFAGRSVTITSVETPVRTQGQAETVTSAPKVEGRVVPIANDSGKVDPADRVKQEDVNMNVTFTQGSDKQIAVIATDPNSIDQRVYVSGQVNLDPLAKTKTFYRVFEPGQKVRVRYFQKDGHVFKSARIESHRNSVVDASSVESPTTVYIKGEEIRIVGDKIRVVYVNDPAKTKARSVKQAKPPVKTKN